MYFFYFYIGFSNFLLDQYFCMFKVSLQVTYVTLKFFIWIQKLPRMRFKKFQEVNAASKILLWIFLSLMFSIVFPRLLRPPYWTFECSKLTVTIITFIDSNKSFLATVLAQFCSLGGIKLLWAFTLLTCANKFGGNPLLLYYPLP